MNARLAILVGALFGAAGVTIGAFHAHGLEEFLRKTESYTDAVVAKKMDQTATAVRYQLIHAVGLLAIAALGREAFSKCLSAGVILFSLGVILFSGGIYLIVFADNSIHWSIVPAGGFCLILGWVVLAIHACCCSSSAK